MKKRFSTRGLVRVSETKYHHFHMIRINDNAQ